MKKATSLKDCMKNGLDGLLSPTTETNENSTSEKHKTNIKGKEPAVHCNFIINKSIHTRMKHLAVEKNVSLKDIVNEAMTEYLDRKENR